MWFQWSLAAVGSDKWSLGVLSRERRLIQLILSWLQALIFVVVLGWLFVPIYIKAGVSQNSTLHFAAHVCGSGLEYCKAIMNGTRSEHARTVLYYVCMYLKNEDSLF